MLVQASTRFDEGQIYISGTREDFKELTKIIEFKKTNLTATGNMMLGKISLSFMRALDEEDKV